MKSHTQRVHEVIEELLGKREPVPGEVGRDLRRLWQRQLRPHRAWLTVAVILTAVWSAMPYGFSFTWRFAVDDVMKVGKEIEPDEVPNLVRLVWFFFWMNMGIWTIRLSFQWLRYKLVASIGQGLVYRLRKDLHRKLQSLHVGFFEKTPVGVIMSRILDDVDVIGTWVRYGAPAGLASLAQVFIGAGVLLYFSWQLGLVVLVSLPIYAWAFAKLRPAVVRAHRALRALNARMYARGTERIGGVRVVKAFAREHAEAQSFSRLVHDSIRVAMRLVWYSQGLSLIAGVITALMTGGILYFGATLVRYEQMSLGQLVGFIGGMNTVLWAVNQLTVLATDVQAALVVLRRVFRVLEEEEEVVPGHISLDGMVGRIEFDRVTFAYPGSDHLALDNVSFRVEPGQRIALMGPSGAGKSTVFQLLLRFYDPDDGELRVGGVDLAEADPWSARRHVRMVQQEPTVFSGTVAENISYGKLDATPQEVMEAARRAELHEFVNSLPLRYQAQVGEGGTTLSGGQKQRLALATALLTDPEVLLLDDTTSALDAATEAKIRETLRHVLQGRTSLIITQRVATARDCDKIIVLEAGRIVQEGTHEELLDVPGFYQDIRREQEEADRPPED
jgi:ABC-type multidrug transport system fused ATPase/permease subunit